MSSNGFANGGQIGHPHSAPPAMQSTVPRRRTARDYQFGARIGEGSYSTVYLAVDLYNKKTYAVKILSKKHIVQEGKIKYVNIEKTTLHRLGVQHPGIVQLYYTFQDELSLFFVLDFAEYGELLSIITKFGSLLESVLKFYMLQILDAVKFIHLKGVIHRDLKPENILVGYDFNLKITDFGAAKLLGEDEESSDEKITYDSVNDDSQNGRPERKGSFVGTAEYVPPELLKHNLCGFETDIWAIACILFQFFNGVPPFKGATEYLTFEKIINIDYAYKEPCPPMVREIIDSTLVLEPLKRPTIPEMQAMPWFKGVPWNNREYIWSRKVPRFEPYSQSSGPGANPPQMKTGSNRNFNKSNSNYQLHSQIQKFDNLVPSFGSKPLYVPATCIRKGGLPQSGSSPAINQSAPHNIAPSQGPAPHMRHETGQPMHDIHYNTQPSLSRVQTRQKPNQAAIRQLAMDPHHVGPHSTQVSKAPTPTQTRQSPQPSPSQMSHSNSYIAAQQASAAFAPLEKSLAETKISGGSKSPEMKNLRANTAFASLPKKSTTTIKVPTAPPPQMPKPTPQQILPPQTQQQARPVQSQAQSHTIQNKPTQTQQAQTSANVERPNTPRNTRRPPVTITLKEISSFLDSDEKIIKLDCVLKLMLSNRLIDRKPGNLDDEVIEHLIGRHEAILNERMMPVIACISNKAKVFLIDEMLDVMMVDLTANKGDDYLMYDYEFEGVILDEEDNSSGVSGQEEVFGYLILELIREGGDLIFLKRFSETDKKKYSSTIRVVNANGEALKIGSNFGWIDCLIWAKQLVDKELKAQKPQSPKLQQTASQRLKSPPTKQVPSAKPSRSSSNSKVAAKGKAKPGLKVKGKSPVEEQGSLNSKPAINSFAYAAAAAANVKR